MTIVEFLKRIFEGYAKCYRKNNWHTTSNYSDMTHTELTFFRELGQSLGYFVRREMNWNYPRDLCWCAAEYSEAFLYFERENHNAKVISTIQKQLNPKNTNLIPNLAAVFGWITEANLAACKDLIRAGLPNNKSFLIIAWIGKHQNGGNFWVEGWIYSGGKEFSRTAIPEFDKDGYWYLYFPNSNISSAWTVCP